MSIDLLTSRVTLDVVRPSSTENKSPLKSASNLATVSSNDQNNEVTRQDGSLSGKIIPVGEVAEENPVINEQELSEAIGRLNNHVQNVQRELEFTVDEESGRVVITVYDAETKEVIREIPPEEVVSLAKNLSTQNAAIMKVVV